MTDAVDRTTELYEIEAIKKLLAISSIKLRCLRMDPLVGPPLPTELSLPAKATG